MDEVADELYSLPPAEFTARRDELAREVAESGDKDASKLIKKLRKPSVSAWLTNMLVRHHPDEAAEVTEVGEALRGAQATLSGDELRDLTARRRQLVDRMVPLARALAAELGHPASEGALQELQGTVQAALVGEDAGRAFAEGRLTKALQPESTFSWALSAPATAPTDTEPVDFQLAKVRKQLEKANREVEDAERAAAERRREATRADDELASATAKVEQLTEALRLAGNEKASAEQTAVAARQASDDADRRVTEARERRAKARADHDAATGEKGAQ